MDGKPEVDGGAHEVDGEPEADGGGGWGARNRARDLKHTYKVTLY